MLFAYFPIIVFENLARMAIATMQLAPSSAPVEKPKNGEPTIILME